MKYQTVLQQYALQVKAWWQHSPSNGTKNTIKVIAVGIAALALMFATSPQRAPNPLQEKAKLISAAKVEAQAATPNINLIGTVTNPRHSSITAAVNALVTHIAIQEGDSVKKGQLLMQLDEAVYQLKLTQLQQQINDFQAQIDSNQLQQQQAQQQLIQQQTLVNLAERKLQRQQRLSGDSLVSQNLLDEARANLAQQQLNLSNARFVKADLPLQQQRLLAQKSQTQGLMQQAQLELERCKIVAPFSGRISKVEVALGGRSFSGTPLLSMYDQSRLQVTAQIPANQLAQIKGHMAQQHKLEAYAQLGNQTVALRLERLAAQVNGSASSVDGFFSFRQDVQLEVGRHIELLLNLPEMVDVYLLPITAVYNNQQVFVVEQQRLRAIPVTVVGRKISNNAQPQLLLQSSESLQQKQVLTTALPQAITGLKVEIVPQAGFSSKAINKPS